MHHKITSNVLYLISQLRQKNSYHHTITGPFQVLIRDEIASKNMRDLSFGGRGVEAVCVDPDEPSLAVFVATNLSIEVLSVEGEADRLKIS